MNRFFLRLLWRPAIVLLMLAAQAQSINGFDLSTALIDVDDILQGGPPRDGIPSIDKPVFVSTRAVDYLRDDDIVVGLVFDGKARAYPLRILIWHEIVNDTFADANVAVTYCPLCGTSMVFSRDINGKTRTFGVSGLLYQSDVLFYDREDESLWSQLGMKAVTGTQAGTALKWLPSEHLTWAAWREEYPQGEVLSPDTGYRRNYDDSPYASYFASDQLMFPAPLRRRELSNKERVVGVLVDGNAKAYALKDLPSGQVVQDRVGGRPLQVLYDAERQHPQITDESGKVIPTVVAFWFAWQAFYPDTGLWKSVE